MSKRDIPDQLQNRLDEFQVEVPEIPMKSSKLERLANWIYSPARDPLEIFRISGNSITRLAFYPLIFVLALFFAPIFFI
ncbi:hypothetical protein [Oceanobacillus neutriphilus]|uniref:Uncharacterized protein n=1 Tax=Oceanobacillus neutriphilus TaxID=531815 RepID=A0ABQ2NSF9_9BACI|nr:hypothetical protein [Oceanobacillus neutriphilus]GGP09545.1 hypothetical protein GCM10011346_14040 [Oceanobacillus neutriphilus]